MEVPLSKMVNAERRGGARGVTRERLPRGTGGRSRARRVRLARGSTRTVVYVAQRP